MRLRSCSEPLAARPGVMAQPLTIWSRGVPARRTKKRGGAAKPEIGFLGFGVWAHHMFAVGMGPVADAVFSLTTMLNGRSVIFAATPGSPSTDGA